MNKKIIKKYTADILESANIQINGPNPWDIHIYNEDFYERVLTDGSLALGEAYMDGWWDCQRLDDFFGRVFQLKLENKIKLNHWQMLKILLHNLYNWQTKARALEVGTTHYDLGNDLFSVMLDRRMNYTCGYWKNAKDLDEAQYNKLELTCKKLMLKPGMKLLDIGCGFGACAKHAAENYGVSVVGITISKEQLAYAEKNCAGLPIELRFQDYRDVNEKFDRIVSLGMFEHVGPKNYAPYMNIVQQCLKEDGIFLLHTIGNNIKYDLSDPWITKYIFPNGMLPIMSEIVKETEGLFVMEDWHNFGADYDKTLLAWYHNFTSHWQDLKNHYDERFYRMWTYYLLSCAGAFRARSTQLWQIVFSKNGVAGGYQAPRNI